MERISQLKQAFITLKYVSSEMIPLKKDEILPQIFISKISKW